MGVEFDLGVEPYEMRIPDDKKTKALNMIRPWVTPGASGRRLSRKDLEELHGMLNWVKEVLVSGSFHLANTVAAFRRCERLEEQKPTLAFLDEMRWWHKVLTDWNCVALVLPPAYATPLYPASG